MIIKPRVRGFMCITSHPTGCAASVREQIAHVRAGGSARIFAYVHAAVGELSAAAPLTFRPGVLTLTGAAAFTRGTITEGVNPLDNSSLAGTPFDNITPAKLNWSAGEIYTYLTTGFTPDYDSVGGHMAHVVDNMAQLPEADVRAVVAYLKALPAID